MRCIILLSFWFYFLFHVLMFPGWKLWLQIISPVIPGALCVYLLNFLFNRRSARRKLSSSQKIRFDSYTLMTSTKRLVQLFKFPNLLIFVDTVSVFRIYSHSHWWGFTCSLVLMKNIAPFTISVSKYVCMNMIISNSQYWATIIFYFI